MTKNEALFKYLKMDYQFNDYRYSILSYNRVERSFATRKDGSYAIMPSAGVPYRSCSRITERTILKLVKLL